MFIIEVEKVKLVEIMVLIFWWRVKRFDPLFRSSFGFKLVVGNSHKQF